MEDMQIRVTPMGYLLVRADELVQKYLAASEPERDQLFGRLAIAVEACKQEMS